MRHCVLATSSLLCAALLVAAPVKFDIPAQPAAEALQAFSRQANVEVLFSFDELRKVNAREVKGEREPDKAISELLSGTGYEAKQTSTRNFVVTKAREVSGSIKGRLVGEGGEPLKDVLVTIRELGSSTSTDRYGEYAFPNVAAGSYVLVATSHGYQPLHITDVSVRGGREATIGRQEMRQASTDDLTRLDAYVVRADDVERLDPYEVSGTRARPFADGNVDIPRTINDAQPYYVYDSRTLMTSGAVNLEDFLKQRLTMNTVALTNAQTSASSGAAVAMGNTSTINLRGLGADKTLVLVNGRRMPSTLASLSELQPDINGISLSAIDRVEVLPTSASGIYGSSALGGVVNIILKRNFSGGEVRATYDNTFDGDAPIRTVSLTYGTSIGPKTQPMLIQDRRDVLDANVARILKNNPALLYSPSIPAQGSLTNIASATTANLTLDNGTNLGSTITYVPAGTAPGTAFAALNPGLIANAGKYDLNYPPNQGYPWGLLRPIGSTPETKSFFANLRHQLLPSIELFADLRYTGNHAEGTYDPAGVTFTVPGSAPTNPFTNNVRVRVPVSVRNSGVVTNTVARSMSIGVNAQLPFEWVAQADYSLSKQHTQHYSSIFEDAAVSAALLSGQLNPFADTLQFGLDLDRYLLQIYNVGEQLVEDAALRGSGPLPALPWGEPRLTTGFGYRRSEMPEAKSSNQFQLVYFFPRWQVARSAYAELSTPLVKENRFPLLYSLEAQIAGRTEAFKVKTGTPNYNFLRTNPTQVNYATPTIGGQPFFKEDTYTQTNYTLGIKYQPIRDVIFRASVANAFIPPTPAQLLDNPTQLSTTINFDPKDPSVTGTKVIPAVTGGNSDLKPQNSESINAGVVWMPRQGWFNNLRLNFEYYKVTQDDFIFPIAAQVIVNNESLFPGRVTRDAAGHITFIDLRQLNVFMRENSGFDITADYYLKTGAGIFSFRGQHSTILTLKTQYAVATPAYDGAGYPNDSDGAIKHTSNATIGWERGSWAVHWTARYRPRYNQVGAPGGPSSMRFANGGPFITGTGTAQGGFTVASQVYHDLVVEYSPRGDRGLTGWPEFLTKDLSLQLGVRNVFDKVAPFDAQMTSNFYTSAYGDMRLRSYWVSLRRAF